MDGDDELLTPNNLRRALYWGQHDVFGLQIESSGSRWTHHRLWKTGRGIHFEGRCHEYPTIGAWPSTVLTDSVVRHHQEPGAGENSNTRNLRILLAEFEDAPRPRTAFYLANTFKDAARYAEAVPWYEKRIAMGVGYRDEWLFAHLYKARCQRAAGDLDAAKSSLLCGAAEAHDWCEFSMELAYLSYDEKKYLDTIRYALSAVDKSQPPTQLWRESNKYTDQPPRLISWCFEHLKDNASALEWAVRARAKIGMPDEDWEARIARLSVLSGGRSRHRARHRVPPASAVIARPKIAICRPGAIGDVLMTLNLIPHLRLQRPNHDIHYFCSSDIGRALKDMMLAAGVDEIGDSNKLNASAYVSVFNLIGYPFQEGYPERPMQRHLLSYFAHELGLDPSVDDLASLRLPLPKRPAGLVERYATMQVKTGWSAYKDWPIERWGDVVKACPEIPIYQIGKEDEPRVHGANHAFMGAPLATSIAIIANASLHIGLDSFANHLTHYRWDDGESVRRVPAVILWGSTQVSASGYPHNTNISLGLSCQPCFREDPAISRMPRGPCTNPLGQVYVEPRHACMFGISAERVTREVRGLWNRTAEDTLPILV